ncbi:MAG: hypothetical protein AB7H97_13760 [Pseudobdellovibrionaceae bacterium]
MTPKHQKGSLSAQVLVSNGYNNLSRIQKLMDGELSEAEVNELFAKENTLQIEAQAGIHFASKYLSGRYAPLSYRAFSIVRNEANPDIELYSIKEEDYTFQSGYELFENFYVGAQLRMVKREFIRKRFLLVELGTEAGKDLLKPKKQSAIYVEPSFLWEIEKNWKYRFAGMVANAGNVSGDKEDLKTPAELQLSMGISPPLPYGTLEFSLDYRSLNYEEVEAKERIGLGALYGFGAMYLMGGVDSNGISGGTFYRVEAVNAGVLYSSTKMLGEEKDYYTQTVYVQLGWQI